MEAELEIQRKAEALAEEALKAPSARRYEKASELCGENKELLMEVLRILGERTTGGADGAEGLSPDPLLNQKIGNYKIHWRLGGGGNGHVYLATRTKEPHQQVAIKFLLLTDGDNEEFRRRFLRERQIIALLNHPYIVKLFDANRTRDGRPYFVMEYVSGQDIDKYANSKKLTIRERLDLFLKVCEAVQYLHSHLIIHRDLKPGNVLVDNDGNPRVLDFGIAKLLRPELMDGDLITTIRHHPLTAQYASPEQWEGGLITSASDVYSLGVVLFELLTGTLPVTLDGKNYTEFQRIVCEGKLPLASKSVVEGHAEFCRQPGTPALVHSLQGDLDAILSKALRRDVNERYVTVAALVEDIQRYLNFLPVRAREGAAWYRAKRFLRRNRSLALAIAAVLLTLVLGLATTLIQRNKAVQEARNISEMARQQEDLVRELRQRVDNDRNQDEQLRAAIRKELDDFEQQQRAAQAQQGGIRGGGGDTQGAQDVARNYELVARLRALAGDLPGAQKAREQCVAILERAQKAGDGSAGTQQLLGQCRAELK